MNVYQGYSSAYTRAKSWVYWAAEPSKPVVNEAQRVCNSCYEAVSEQEELWIYIQALHVIGLELPLLKRAATVCKNWRRAVILCLSALRELQYLLPTGTLTANEKKMLWNNRSIWAGHSQWIIAMLKAVDWDDPEAARQAIEILKTPERRYSCWRTMCSRSCEKSLTPADSLWLLSEDMHNLELREYAVERLQQSSPVELLCYLPVLVHDIRYGDSGPLVEFLLGQALADYHFCNDLYWALVTCAESKKHKRLYDSVLQKLLVAITSTHGEARARQLIIGQDLVSFLEAIPAPPNAQQIQGLLSNLDRLCRTPIALPINSTIEARSFRPEGVKIKQSKTAPIVIPCITRSPRPTIYTVSGTAAITQAPTEDYEYTFMFKREDVRKDQIVLNVIRLMDIIIKKELNYDLKVLTYRVIPTGSSDGLIEMMPHSKTLFEILRTSKIHTHLVNNNGGSQVHSLLTTYMCSLAAWTVITYLLGVGDRHMDNIMLTDSGILFHIDYGFVLGKDPKPLAPHIRMNDSMIEGMGGKDSSHYMEFKKICADVFLCLRRHISLFFNLLLVMAKADPPVTDLIFDAKYLEEQLSKRFLPGQTEAEARSTIYHLVHKTDGYVQSVTDFLHQHSRENTISESVKSITNVSSYAYNGALNYFNWSNRK
jgi:phosphatidylinositol 3-kinase